MGENQEKGKKSRGKKVLTVLGVLALAGAAAYGVMWYLNRPVSVQEEVDWPPDHHGYFEVTSHNELRSMEQGGWTPPGTFSVCNLPGEAAIDTVASVPTAAQFLIYQAGQVGWEYHFYHSVEVPDTGECVRVSRANEVEGVTAAADASDADMVTVSLPNPLEVGQTYMLTAGSDPIRGMVVTVPAPE